MATRKEKIIFWTCYSAVTLATAIPLGIKISNVWAAETSNYETVKLNAKTTTNNNSDEIFCISSTIDRKKSNFSI